MVQTKESPILMYQFSSRSVYWPRNGIHSRIVFEVFASVIRIRIAVLIKVAIKMTNIVAAYY